MVNYIVFVCGHNAGRSQMAQAFFNSKIYNNGNFPSLNGVYEAISAGTRHSDRINPLVVQAMGEVGIDMNDTTIYFPKALDSDYVRSRGDNIKRVIVACDDKCELPPEIGKNLTPEYWELPDPHGQSLEVVREVRDLTEKKVGMLLEELVAAER